MTVFLFVMFTWTACFCTASLKADDVTALSPDNPFATKSDLSNQYPNFDNIQIRHYQPAFQYGMAEQLREVKEIAEQTESPTFENTIARLEKSGAVLKRVSSVFDNLTSAHTNPDLQNIQKEMAPLLAGHSDDIQLNPKLFGRIRKLYDSRDTLQLTPEQQEVLRQRYKNAVLAGALLSESQQLRIRSLNEQLSALQTEFEENLLAITKERSLLIKDIAELDGLSESQIAAAAEKAEQRGAAGNYLLEIDNTTRVPLLASLNNRSVRERLWKTSAERGLGQNGGIDNRKIVLEIAQLRAERAQLLGFENHAAYKISNQMAETPAAALKMLTDLVPGVVARVNQEAADLNDYMASAGVEHSLQPWDWEYYAERLRKQKFEVDDAAVKPYFEVNTVLEKGVFHTMHRLFGIRFEERTDLPKYHPQVRTFNVLDKDGSEIGIFLIDFFKRDSKRGGAWMNAYVSQSKLLQQRPVIVNVLNNVPPASGQPALITFDNVTTMFHEMGHAVHGLLSDVKYPSVAGTATPQDFVEFPSTFQEDWCIDPEILKNYAVHHQTGKPIPTELLQKVIAASKFNQGFDTLEYLAAAILDLEWHALGPDEIPADIEVFEAAVLKKHGINLPAVPPRYRTAYFSHIWGGGYSAGYYAYLWSEVLAADAFAYMNSQGGATSANGEKFRKEILSRGSSRHPMKSYEAFRGQKPTVDAILIRRGLK